MFTIVGSFITIYFLINYLGIKLFLCLTGALGLLLGSCAWTLLVRLFWYGLAKKQEDLPQFLLPIGDMEKDTVANFAEILDEQLRKVRRDKF